MKQRTLAMMTGFERYSKKTRRAVFLEEMEQVVPWKKLCALVGESVPASQGSADHHRYHRRRDHHLGAEFDEEPRTEMHQTKKGNQWHFGMKAHVGVDSQTKMIHTACCPHSNPKSCGKQRT